MKKKKIAIDMDEVMADTGAKLIYFLKEKENYIIDPEKIKGKDIWEVLPSDIQAKVYNWISEKGFFRDLAVMPNSQEVIQKLSTQYEIFIVSAATEFKFSMEDKYDWLKEHFPFISETHFVFCGHKTIVQADYMIDDRAKNFAEFNGTPLLFDAHHNHFETDFKRVYSWTDIENILLD